MMQLETLQQFLEEMKAIEGLDAEGVRTGP